MSRLIHLLNTIKDAEAVLELTPSQHVAHRAISDALQRYGQCNLCGNATSGKTFLCWRLARECGTQYLTSPTFLDTTPINGRGVVIDNASARRSDYRRLLSVVQVRRSQPLLYVSRLPVEEEMPQITLYQTEDDQSAMIRNLRAMKFDVPADTYSDLWDVIVAAAGGSW